MMAHRLLVESGFRFGIVHAIPRTAQQAIAHTTNDAAKVKARPSRL